MAVLGTCPQEAQASLGLHTAMASLPGAAIKGTRTPSQDTYVT